MEQCQLFKGMFKAKYLSVLKAAHADHPFVQGLVQVEGAFERESSKYITA